MILHHHNSGCTPCTRPWPRAPSYHVSRGRCGRRESTGPSTSCTGISRGRSTDRGSMHYETCHTRNVNSRDRLFLIYCALISTFVLALTCCSPHVTLVRVIVCRYDRSCCRKFTFLVNMNYICFRIVTSSTKQTPDRQTGTTITPDYITWTSQSRRSYRVFSTRRPSHPCKE